MPYGLANSPSFFQGFMNEVFREFLHHFAIIYIKAELRHHVMQVLQKFRENLVLKA